MQTVDTLWMCVRFLSCLAALPSALWPQPVFHSEPIYLVKRLYTECLPCAGHCTRPCRCPGDLCSCFMGFTKARAQTNRQPITRPRDHCWGQGQAEGYGDHWQGPSPRLGDSGRVPEEVYALTDGKEVFTKGRREGRKLFQAVGKTAAKA